MSQLTLLPSVLPANSDKHQSVATCKAGHVYNVALQAMPDRRLTSTGEAIQLEWRPTINQFNKCGIGPALAGDHDPTRTTDPQITPNTVQKPIQYPLYRVDLAAFFAPSRGQLFIVGTKLPSSGFFAFSDRPLMAFENPPPWTLTLPAGGSLPGGGPGTRPIDVPPAAVSIVCPTSGVVLTIDYGGGSTVVVTTTAGAPIPLMGALTVQPAVVAHLQFRLQF